MNDLEFRRKMCFKKKAYSTFKYATKVKNILENKRKIFLRVYQCPICGFFHLTSLIEDSDESL